MPGNYVEIVCIAYSFQPAIHFSIYGTLLKLIYSIYLSFTIMFLIENINN